MHSPKVKFDLLIGHGSQDLMCKAYEMLIAPGDCILMESPTYVGVLAFLRPYGAKMISVDTDSHGLTPSSLDTIMTGWTDSKPRPKVLYTVATAGNPTGVTTPTWRKQEIYKLAQKWNLLILEDDPYYFLQYDEPLERSYFSMDTDGRVLRFDSFSKVLSAGARLGFVSGPPALIERLTMHQMATVLNASGLSQLLIWEFLKSKGLDGFHLHTRFVAGLYKERRDYFIGLLDRYLKGKAEWTVPVAGMFVWIRLIGVTDSFKLISEKAVEAGVLLVPGKEFYPNPQISSYVRASFSYSSEEDMEKGVQRLASLLE
jgi:kynurenine/2-aminoadipate aminotransferase